MIKCIAVDDEPLALELIKKHCAKIATVELKYTFLSVLEAIDFLSREPVDVAFFDINMPEINGLKAKKLIPQETQVVYITAYEKYAIKSYDLNATDYLLKPVSFERFYRAIQKCEEKKQLLQSSNPLDKQLALEKTILLRGDKKVFQIAIKDIEYIEGFKDYAKIHIGGNQKIVIRESLKNILEELKEDGFLRVHRSFIIPLHKISLIEGNMLWIGKHRIPANKAQRDLILDTFKKRGILGDRSK